MSEFCKRCNFNLICLKEAIHYIDIKSQHTLSSRNNKYTVINGMQWKSGKYTLCMQWTLWRGKNIDL